MRLLLFIFLIIAPCAASNAQIGRGFTFSTAAASGGSCGAWTSPIDQRQTATDNDFFNGSASSAVSQGIHVTASGNVCKVKLKVYTATGTADVFVQLRTAANGGGSQIGANSAHQTATTTQTIFDFDFSSPIAVSADFFINVFSSDNSFNCKGTNAEVYQGTSYSAWQGATNFTAEDLYFEVWSQ